MGKPLTSWPQGIAFYLKQTKPKLLFTKQTARNPGDSPFAPPSNQKKGEELVREAQSDIPASKRLLNRDRQTALHF